MSDNGIREQLLESLPDAVFVVAADGQIVFVNAQAVRLFGYDRDRVVGQPIDLLVPDRAKSVHPGHRRRYFQAPQVRPMGAGLDLSGRRADGTEFPCEISLSALETPDGRLVTAVVRDVTERLKTQQKFQGLLEAAPDAMIGVDSHGLIRLVNGQTERLFGYHRSELLGQGIEILVPERTRLLHPRHRARYFADPQVRPMGAGHELFGARKDGTEFPAEISLSSIETEDGILVTAAVRDVSERKAFELMVERARDTAERAARARQDFLANMSHEIRTPMNAVIGITTLLLDTHLDAQQRDYVETVRASGDHLLTIISDILDYAKIDSGKVVLEDVEFSLHSWVEDTLDLLAQQATDKGLELVADIEPGTPVMVRGDPGRLRQVLINVVSNALKFTVAGEVVVKVASDRLDDTRCTIRIDVRDTGIGVAPERLAALFDPFTQADSTTTREYGGTGLGLAISRRLAELMGGTVDLWSVPNEGTTARVTLTVTALQDPPEPRRHLTSRELLVVDDNATCRRVLAGWARDLGFAVVTATSAEEALAQAAGFTGPVAALIDHTLPGTDGARLGRQLRDRHPDAQLVLMSPALLGAHNRSSAVYDAVIAKPVKRSQVQTTLTALAGDGLGAPPRTPDPVQPSPFELSNRAPLSILVVEDNPVNQKVARHMLARFGYRADMAWSGAEALDILARRTYDLVLMDVQMPEMDGLETTRRIRARYPTSGPRVVAMTANVSRASISSCLSAGMDSFLGKPVAVGELAALLEDLSRNRGEPPPAVLAPHDLLDLAVLERLGDDIGHGTVTELVAMFRDDVERSAPHLAAAATSGDKAEVAGLAHRLRSAARTLGAEHLADMLGALEDELPPDGALPTLVDAVVDELRLVVVELSALVRTGS